MIFIKILSVNREKFQELNLDSFDNYLIISSRKSFNLNNVLILENLPIKLNKLIQIININFLKTNFVKQSKVRVGNYRLDLNSREIILDNLSFRFENSKKDTLLDINIEIKKGSYIGISGESGAGKTTIMNLLLGLYKPTKGQILVDGIDINENLGSWQSKIGYVPQNIYFIDDSIKKNIAFGYENNSINEKRVLESLKLSKLYNLYQI